eukprot:2410799-Karenia_brevis.AAC.1
MGRCGMWGCGANSGSGPYGLQKLRRDTHGSPRWENDLKTAHLNLSRMMMTIDFGEADHRHYDDDYAYYFDEYHDNDGNDDDDVAEGYDDECVI